MTAHEIGSKQLRNVERERERASDRVGYQNVRCGVDSHLEGPDAT